MEVLFKNAKPIKVQQIFKNQNKWHRYLLFFMGGMAWMVLWRNEPEFLTAFFSQRPVNAFPAQVFSFTFANCPFGNIAPLGDVMKTAFVN